MRIDTAPPTARIGRPGDVTHHKLAVSRGGVDIPGWSIALSEA